jgi:hypothetical protein
MGEYQITPAGLLVARETAFHERRVCRFAVLEVTKSPATGCSVFGRLLDHKLNVGRRAGNKRLRLAEGFVVLLRWNVTVVQRGDDCPVWERKRFVAVSLDRYIVAQYGGTTVEVALFMGHRDPLPVAISGRDLRDVRRSCLSIGSPRYGRDRGDNAD